MMAFLNFVNDYIEYNNNRRSHQDINHQISEKRRSGKNVGIVLQIYLFMRQPQNDINY